jgi:hypothetical protein
VLSADIFAIAPEAILTTRADITLRDGLPIFDRHGEMADAVAAQ